jgi:hypothetical protein
MKKLADEDKKDCVCELGKKWSSEEDRCVECDKNQCQQTADGTVYDNGKNNCGMCEGTAECDITTFTCSDAIDIKCSTDEYCQKIGKGYCEKRSFEEYGTCNPDFCNPYDGGGKPCPGTQVCAGGLNSNIISSRCSDTYCTSDEQCKSSIDTAAASAKAG